MTLALTCMLVVVTMSTTTSQPTCDFNQVSDCGCRREIEMLQRQIILLKNEVDSVLVSGHKNVTRTTASMSSR